MTIKLWARHDMAQFCYGWLTEEGTTLYLSIDRYNLTSAPRFYFGNAPSIAVVNPERFGSWSTAKEFKAWCEKFANASRCTDMSIADAQPADKRERRPHYECNHKTTICRDCDGSKPATDPWSRSTIRT